jgi:hypothetical protein
MSSITASSLKGLSRAWFPAALIVLVVLAVPGAILFALNLLGFEGPVNRWLQDNYRLSYHIPVPRWAGLLLLLLPVALVLLYFLKLKRKPLHVPSTFLWKKSIEDLHVNAFFQWLRDNLLLILQLLVLLALIYAIMAFQFHGSSTAGQHYILMIDNSASMSATTDVGPNRTRLDEAKDEALREIDAHGDDDFGMVLVFNSEATTRQSYTNDRSLLRRAVEAIEPTQRPTRIKDALDLADGLANPRRSTANEASRPANEEPGKERTYDKADGIPTEVHLFSDGRFPDVPDFNLGNLNMRFHSIGQSGPENVDNVGIVSLNATRDEKDPTRLQVLASVRNYRSKETKVRVALYMLIDGQLVGTFVKTAQPQGTAPANPDEAKIPARYVQAGDPAKPDQEQGQPVDRPGEGFVAFDLGNVDDRSNVILHAELPDIKDQFPLDNEAWLVVGVVRKSHVLVVGSPNRILHAFFDNLATRKVAEVTYLDPDDLQSEEKYRRPALAGKFDLVIFDRCTVAKVDDLPLANTFFIDQVPPPWKKEEMPKVKNPRIKGWLTDDPLLRYLAALYDVGIDEAFQFNLDDKNVPPRTPRLLETDKNTAVMFSLNRQSFRDVVLTFSIVDDAGGWNTNWPLHPSFPLFLRNVLYSLGHVSDAAAEETVQPGQVKTLRPDTAVQRIDVEDPKGSSETLQRGARAEFAYGKTEQVGVYNVHWDNGEVRSFPVNLLDAEESNIEPRPEFQIGNSKVVAGEVRVQPRETWKWVALAALVFVLLEWIIYNRRIFV